MIKHLLDSYRTFDRDVDALSWLLGCMVLVVVGRAIVVLYQAEYDLLWPMLPASIPIIAALLVVRVANRQITYGTLTRADDKRQDLVRVTHHLIAIIQDMRQRVGYLHSLLDGGKATPLVLDQITTTIERRYESLMEPDAYKYLPGPCIDIIVSISGSIFGLATMAKGVSQMAAANPIYSATGSVPQSSPEVISQLSKLKTDITRLLDGVYEVRNGVEAAPQHTVRGWWPFKRVFGPTAR